MRPTPDGRATPAAATVATPGKGRMVIERATWLGAVLLAALCPAVAAADSQTAREATLTATTTVR